jgi:hypothetical protein
VEPLARDENAGGGICRVGGTLVPILLSLWLVSKMAHGLDVLSEVACTESVTRELAT